MKFGYIRVSTSKQNLEVQEKAITDFGVDEIYQEKVSGRNTDRQELNNLLKVLREGDSLIVYDLSRLGRTVHQVMKLVEDFIKRKISFVSLKERFDTSSPIGKAMLSILASFNQMQVEIQNEKIKEGLANAKSKGVKLGRKSLPEKTIKLIKALSNQGYSNIDISNQLNISVRSVINYKKL